MDNIRTDFWTEALKIETDVILELMSKYDDYVASLDAYDSYSEFATPKQTIIDALVVIKDDVITDLNALMIDLAVDTSFESLT
jgi:hypothetical protein